MALDPSSSLSTLGAIGPRVVTPSAPPRAAVDDTRTFHHVMHDKKVAHRSGGAGDQAGIAAPHTHSAEGSESARSSLSATAAATDAGQMAGPASAASPATDHGSAALAPQLSLVKAAVQPAQSRPRVTTGGVTGHDVAGRHGLATRDSGERPLSVVAKATSVRSSASTGSLETRGSVPPSPNARRGVATSSGDASNVLDNGGETLRKVGDAGFAGSPGSDGGRSGSRVTTAKGVAGAADQSGRMPRMVASTPSRSEPSAAPSSSLEPPVSRSSSASPRIGPEAVAPNSSEAVRRRAVPYPVQSASREAGSPPLSRSSRWADVVSRGTPSTSAAGLGAGLAASGFSSPTSPTAMTSVSAPETPNPSTSGTSPAHAQVASANIDLTRFIADVSRTLVSPGDYRVSLALHPESLGTVRATLSLSGNDLSVSILPDSHRGHEALVRELDTLRTELSRGGLSVNVTLHDHGASRGQRETSQFAHGHDARITKTDPVAEPIGVTLATQIHVIL